MNLTVTVRRRLTALLVLPALIVGALSGVATAQGDESSDPPGETTTTQPQAPKSEESDEEAEAEASPSDKAGPDEAGVDEATVAAIEEIVSSPEPYQIVLLGDSYISGNGATDENGNRSYYGPEGCYRSHDTWGERYAEMLAVSGIAVETTNNACSGASVADIYSPRSMGNKTYSFRIKGNVSASDASVAEAIEANGYCVAREPGEYFGDYDVSVKPPGWFSSYSEVTVSCERFMAAQVDIIDDNTDLVLLSIGGNDVGFPAIVEQCFVVGIRDPGDCREHVGFANDSMSRVQEDLTAALVALGARMNPEAQIGLFSYPYLELNDSYTLRWFWWDSYRAGEGIRTMQRTGDEAQREAVSDANAILGREAVVFVDTVKEAFAGHEPDGSASRRNPDRWLHEFETYIPAEWYHPNPYGHLGYAIEAEGAFPAPATGPQLAEAAVAALVADDGESAFDGAFSEQEGAQLVATHVDLGAEYAIESGEELVLSPNVSGSFEVALFEWDLDGDGEFELSTAEAEVTFAANDTQTVVVAVRVSDVAGLTATASAVVDVSPDGDGIPAEVDNCPYVYNHGQEDYDGDGVGYECDRNEVYPYLSERN